MPWEKSFDTDNALEKAMNVFWAKGYEETSMSDLINAMGINKGSLYNAYGDKKSLFISVLRKYDEEQSRVLLSQIKQIDNPVEAISSFFDCIIEGAIEDKEYKGCLLINTSLKLHHFDNDIRSIVERGLKEVEKFFESCIDKINTKNKEDTNSKDKAKILMSLVVGLKVLSRGAFDSDSLHTVKEQALQIIL